MKSTYHPAPGASQPPQRRDTRFPASADPVRNASSSIGAAPLTGAALVPARTGLLLGILVFSSLSGVPDHLVGQTPAAIQNPTELVVPRFDLAPPPDLVLAGPARDGVYAGAVGSRAAWLGTETGRGELWVHPLKVVRELGLSFRVSQYDQPISGQRIASRVVVAPGHLEVHYTHEGFVVRQHILAPRDLPGILMLLEVEAVVELEIQVEFQPVFQYAWPGGLGGQYLYWDEANRAFVLSESLQRRNAILGSPWASQASAHPAHRLAEAPSVFTIPVDAERARDELIPIVLAAGTAPREEVLDTYRELLSRAPEIVGQIHAWGSEVVHETFRFSASPTPMPEGPPISPPFRREDLVSPEPPPSREMAAPLATPPDLSGSVPPAIVDWAKVNLAEQTVCNPDLGCGFVAGWGISGTSLRPGFGWFFGGDAAINTLAMDATGQWEDVAQALRFLARYQRDDGKIPHEISQAAGTIPWFEEFPYAYYHADTTPYWMLALWHYWRASGDDELVRELWPAFEAAYGWCLSVETDGDGIIENTTGGLGAIEVGGLGEGIHQDIYLAAVWTEALQGTVELARHVGEDGTASQAQELLQRARETLNRRYWMEDQGYHAFGILRSGGTNGNLTAWPATALGFGLLETSRAEGTLRHLARSTIAADWGARLLATESPLYDPLHYNNGMVWPFMTGFVAWGQYRYRRPWAGYPLLEALWHLHGDWSLGHHPENLSGAFYQVLDATVPHQFFASSMLVTPLVRGVLGWEPDAPRSKVTLAPQFHPTWRNVQVENLPVGDTRIHLDYRRSANEAEAVLTSRGPAVELTYIQGIPLGARKPVLVGDPDLGPGEQTATSHDIQNRITFTISGGQSVRLHYRWEGGVEVFTEAALELHPGSSGTGPRILDFTREGEEWLVTVEGEAGSWAEIMLRGESLEADPGQILPGPGPGEWRLRVPLTAGEGRVVRTVRLAPAG